MMKLAEKEISIKVPWGKLAALTWGDESHPPVLLCHGIQDVCSGYRPLVALLPPSLFYVSIDLPGSGMSDPFPKFARFTSVDYVPVILAVQKHFNWKTFMYIGHSLGVVIGKYFDIAYPDVISRMVELDPVPAYRLWSPKNFGEWYHEFYGNYYQEDRYLKNNAGWDTAPKYTYEKALDLMMNNRGLTSEASKHILERALVSIGDGLYRFTYDQRQKDLPRLPLNADFTKKLYTSTKTPIFCTLSREMIKLGVYHYAPFVKNECEWYNNNYTVKLVNGGHDNHINDPEGVAADISKFLLEDFKSKSKL